MQNSSELPTKSSGTTIHPTAVISSQAKLGAGVIVGPFVVIDGNVELGEGCVVGPQVNILGNVKIGPRNTFHSGCIIGGTPQHLGYANEETRTEIGSGNIFREYVTVHRGMPATGTTIIGDNNFFMANSHVAHDCRVGNHTIFANGAVIAGHVHVQNNVFVSALCAVHQFCRIGRLAMLSGLTPISQDVPPFWTVQGLNTPVGINIVGMKRAGMSHEEIMIIKRTFKTITRKGLTMTAAIEEVMARDGNIPSVRETIEFIQQTKRGIVLSRRRKRISTHDE